MKFSFETANKIKFGPGILEEALIEAIKMGTRVFLVTGGAKTRLQHVRDFMEEENRFAADYQITGEPTVSSVTNAVVRAKEAECDMVVGIGGGSVIDAGKAVAAMLTNPGEIGDYLEVVGKGLETKRPSAPYVAVPTTAGTGAEVTKNAVIGSPEHKVKVSMRSPLMLPQLAVIDPELTLSLPPEMTAFTGLDALTQLIEAFASRAANPLTDALCCEGLHRAARSIRQAYSAGHDLAARQDMAIASLFSGLALANAKLGAVHGLAAPMGGLISAPHGALCAGLLPHVIEMNLKVLKDRSMNVTVQKRFNRLAKILTGNRDASAGDGVQWMKKLCVDLNVPPLVDYGLNTDTFETIAQKSRRASSMKGNPVDLTEGEIVEILKRALRGGATKNIA